MLANDQKFHEYPEPYSYSYFYNMMKLLGQQFCTTECVFHVLENFRLLMAKFLV